MYRIQYTKQAKKSLETLPKKDMLLIFEKISLLASNPRPSGSIQMKGKFASYQRIRVGNYRVIYDIEDKALLILVVKIGQRGSVYEH